MKVFDYDNLILVEKIFGLEIVDNVVKVLELKRSGGKFSIVGFAEQKVDPAAFSDGVIINKDLVAGVIKTVRDGARPKRIKKKYVGVVLPDSKIFVRVVKFPVGMTKDEIREAIEWKAKDLIAMPLNKVYWDWHRLRTEDGERESEVVISAVEKECVNSYTQTLKLLGITPLYYDISGNAAARFLFQSEYKKKKALLVRIDRNSTTLCLFLKGGVRYKTIIKDVVKGGYGALIDYASAKLGVDKKEAEGLILSPKNLNNEQKNLLNVSFEVNFNGLLQEIRQILDYYSQTLDNAKGDRNSKDNKDEDFAGIFLYGKGAQVYYIKEFFKKKSIEVRTQPPDKSALSPMLPFISRKGLPQHIVLLGLSLRNLGQFKELRDINLVPKSIKEKYLQVSIYSSLYTYLRMIFWNVFIIGVILTFAFIVSMIYKYNAGQELIAVENIAESRANKQLREDILYLNQTAGQASLLFDTQLNWDKFFIEVSDRRGDGIVYSNLLVSEDPEAWKAISGETKVVKESGFIYLVISGVAEKREDLQRYVLGMETSGVFENVKLPISNYETNENIEFTIYCLVNVELLKY